MKKMFFSAIAAIVLSGIACSANENPAGKSAGNPSAVRKTEWLTRLGEAQSAARKEKKPILVNFTGSDWCPWCVRLHDEVFAKKAFADYAGKNLILLVVDFPRKKKLSAEQRNENNALANKYGIEGFPTVLLLSPEGSVIARTGYRRGGAESYVKHLQNLLNK